MSGRLELLPWQSKVLGQDSSLKLGGIFSTAAMTREQNISQTLNLL